MGSIDANNIMPDIANDVYVQSSSMAAPLIQSGYANTIMPYMNMYGNSSIVWALLISKEDIQISYLELIELPHHTRLLRN